MFTVPLLVCQSHQLLVTQVLHPLDFYLLPFPCLILPGFGQHLQDTTCKGWAWQCSWLDWMVPEVFPNFSLILQTLLHLPRQQHRVLPKPHCQLELTPS